ncbi:MAG: hypothetical protein KF799_03475 [Bdellovibrionales bacterium]|nr:hypothetical protein [Bdellovibrionales bacterium]
MKIRALWTLAFCLLSACASQSKIEQTEFQDENHPDFGRGLKALEREDYGTAASIFDRLLVQSPASEMDLVTSFNSGNAYEGLGNCNKASERYREVVRGSAGKFPGIEAQALYRLSLTYECLGQDTKTVTSLLDAKKREKQLPMEVARAEIPARLAAAYSRLGNKAKALEYFNEASEGLKSIAGNGSTPRAQKEALGKTLFYMGHLNPAQKLAEVEPIGYLQALSMQQPYLLQAVEMGHQVWSRKAAEDLNMAYDNMLRFQIADPEKRNQFYTRALQVIGELRKIRLPDAGKAEDEVFAKVDRTERRIQNEIATIAETTRLTPDAEKREGLRRQGRPVDPRTKPPVKRIKK